MKAPAVEFVLSVPRKLPWLLFRHHRPHPLQFLCQFRAALYPKWERLSLMLRNGIPAIFVRVAFIWRRRKGEPTNARMCQKDYETTKTTTRRLIIEITKNSSSSRELLWFVDVVLRFNSKHSTRYPTRELYEYLVSLAPSIPPSPAAVSFLHICLCIVMCKHSVAPGLNFANITNPKDRLNFKEAPLLSQHLPGLLLCYSSLTHSLTDEEEGGKCHYRC